MKRAKNNSKGKRNDDQSCFLKRLTAYKINMTRTKRRLNKETKSLIRKKYALCLKTV